MVTTRKSRALGLLACQRMTLRGGVSLFTRMVPFSSKLHVVCGRGMPATII
jgi:hypothetical protein